MNQMKRKVLPLLAGSLGATVLIAGCGVQNTTGGAGSNTTSGSAKSPVIVTFWESHSAANQQGHAIARIVSNFNQQNPGIKVIIHVTPASAKALAAVQAGDPPVMAMIGHAPQYGYEQANALVNLKPLIYGKDGFPKAQLNGIWPGVWKAEFTPSGQQYLFPVDVKVAEFYYNVDLWKQAGIKSTPTTWSQLNADAQLIAQKTHKLGMAARLDHNDWLPMVYSNGGQFFKAGSKTTLDLNTPAMQQTIQQIKTRVNTPGVKVLSYNTGLEDFASGDLGILENTADGYEMVRQEAGGKFPVGAFQVPVGTTGSSYYLYQGLSFVIFSHSTPAQQQAAWNFIKYFDSPQGQAIWSVIGGEPPISSADVSAVAKMAGSQFWQNPGPFTGTAVALKSLESGHVIHKILGPAQSEVDGVIQTQIQEAVQGKESVSKALGNMESQGNSFLQGTAVQ